MVFCLSRSCAEEFRGIRGVLVESAPEPTDVALTDVVSRALANHNEDLEALRMRGLQIIREIARNRPLKAGNDNPDPETKLP